MIKLKKKRILLNLSTRSSETWTATQKEDWEYILDCIVPQFLIDSKDEDSIRTLLMDAIMDLYSKNELYYPEADSYILVDLPVELSFMAIKIIYQELEGIPPYLIPYDYHKEYTEDYFLQLRNFHKAREKESKETKNE